MKEDHSGCVVESILSYCSCGVVARVYAVLAYLPLERAILARANMNAAPVMEASVDILGTHGVSISILRQSGPLSLLDPCSMETYYIFLLFLLNIFGHSRLPVGVFGCL